MKKVFTFFLTLFVASSVWAYDFVVDGIYYDIDEELNSSVSVVRSYEGSITIPSSVTYGGKTYNVTSIGGGAFHLCTGLTSVTIPNSVTSIGGGAFKGCSGLTSVTIGNSVTSIGDDAFYGCFDLTSVTIPNSVTSIGDYAFYDCSGLTSVTIGNSVTSIGDYAFYDCIDLTSVTIGNSVTSIGGSAFSGCSDLKEVINLSSLEITHYVGYYTYVYNGGKIVVGDFLFSKNDKILKQYVGSSANVVLPENFEGGSYTISSIAFANNTEIQSVTISSGVTSIGYRAFSGCSGLTSLTIPNSVTSIGDVAFSGCSGLTSVTIPNSVTSIGDNAFYGCSGLTSVTIPNSVTSIGDDAFSGCSGLTSLTIPNSVTSIGYDAFYGCSGLTSVTIPESLNVSWADIYFTKNGIRYNVLNGKVVDVVSNSYTGNIVIPSSVTAGNTFSVMGFGYAFYGCSGLTSVTIPNSVGWIREEAFYGCTSLKNVVIGENVTSIGADAFSDCSALSKVTCYAVNPPDVDASSFSNYNGYLTIPCDNFEAYDIHPVWGNFKHVNCISAESTELAKDEVVVEPEISEAVFSMPTNASANSYTLTIQNNGVTFCTLTFNNQGQLSNIDFSGNTLKSEIEGYQFTVTGLSASTGYNYSFKALDKSKSVLKEYTGSFTTKNADGTGGSSTTAIDDVEFANAISIVNNQIFVNGEAPEFVITSLGQKIANQNLKSGIYFVVVEGQNVKASIR